MQSPMRLTPQKAALTAIWTAVFYLLGPLLLAFAFGFVAGLRVANNDTAGADAIGRWFASHLPSLTFGCAFAGLVLSRLQMLPGTRREHGPPPPTAL